MTLWLISVLANERFGRRRLENREQGRAKPNEQAALVIRIVQRYPNTVRRLAEI